MPTVNCILDTRRPNKEGNYPIKLRITHKGKRRLYGFDTSLIHENDWVLVNQPNVPKALKAIRQEMDIQVAKALQVIRKLEPFTFAAYDQMVKPKKHVKPIENLITLKKLFYIQMDMLMNENRLGYADGFRTTWNNLKKYNGGNEPSFSDITVSFLKGFQASFTAQGKSLTTVGIQLRNLRTVVNIAKDRGLMADYPFGKRKYQIPTGRNVKKALNLSDIETIYKLKELTEKESLARDIFYFSYLCNGMNLKDILNLKWTDIEDNCITFRRAKTIRHNNQPITIPINQRIQAIIDRLGDPDSPFIFPFINPLDSPYSQRLTLKVMTKKVNEGLAGISVKAKLPKRITTYAARHTFSTILQRSGAPISFISEALGHSSLVTTQNYLAGFDIKAKQQWQKALIQ